MRLDINNFHSFNYKSFVQVRFYHFLVNSLKKKLDWLIDLFIGYVFLYYSFKLE